MGTFKSALLAGVLTSVTAGTALAGPDVYVQVLGGGAAPLDTRFDPGAFINPTLTGWALAGTVGVVVQPGLAVEADVLYTDRAYGPSAVPDGHLSTTSLMLNGKIFMPVSSFDLYAAAGIGMISVVSTDNGTPFSMDPGLGYQLIGGASVPVSDVLSIVGEVRFQNSFQPYTDIFPGEALSAPTVTALFGVKAGF